MFKQSFAALAFCLSTDRLHITWRRCILYWISVHYNITIVFPELYTKFWPWARRMRSGDERVVQESRTCVCSHAKSESNFKTVWLKVADRRQLGQVRDHVKKNIVQGYTYKILYRCYDWKKKKKPWFHLNARNSTLVRKSFGHSLLYYTLFCSWNFSSRVLSIYTLH